MTNSIYWHDYETFGRVPRRDRPAQFAGVRTDMDLVAEYQERTGHELHDLDWYEAFALVRSTAIMTRIGLLARANGETPSMPIEDSPIFDLLRDRTTRS